MKVHLGIHLRFAADVHNSTSTCVVQPVIHLCFAADVHISWLDSRSANVSPTRQAFGFCRGGTHSWLDSSSRGTLGVQWSALVEPWGHLHDFGAALGATWVTCGSVWVNFGGFAGSLGALCWRGACSGGYLVCLFAFM